MAVGPFYIKKKERERLLRERAVRSAESREMEERIEREVQRRVAVELYRLSRMEEEVQPAHPADR